MKIDIAHHIGAVSRAVESRTHDGQPAHAVIASRAYDTTVDDLWDALTSKERIPRWFLPVSGDLHLGGHYQLQGNAGGTITRCEPPRHLAVTWEFGGQVSWVDVRLAPTANGRAHLELQHVMPMPDATWDQYGPGAVGVGWDMALVGLEIHMGTGAAVDPQEAAAWLGSENGKAFARQSSDDWCRASVASGADAAAAEAAASRTVAAYTGEPTRTAGQDAPA